jgi:hypothetical protein
MTSIEFWAQSLDNISSNSIASGHQMLDPEKDEKQRQDIVSNVYSIVSEKTKVKFNPEETDIVVYCKGSEFVIEAIPIQRDVVDRLSPIIIYGKFPRINANVEDGEKWADKIYNEIEWFVNEINRELSEQTSKSIKRWLNAELIKKKQKKTVENGILTLAILVIIPLIMGKILQYFYPELRPFQVSLIMSVSNLLSGVIILVTLSNNKAKMRR